VTRAGTGNHKIAATIGVAQSSQRFKVEVSKPTVGWGNCTNGASQVSNCPYYYRATGGRANHRHSNECVNSVKIQVLSV
jgi:hypothetical protein